MMLYRGIALPSAIADIRVDDVATVLQLDRTAAAQRPSRWTEQIIVH
jgi:hypothetical protein